MPSCSGARRSTVSPPEGLAACGWMLAGGLNPGNVAEAVSLTGARVVDVSSGVCGPDGLLKDHAKVAAFIAAAKGASKAVAAA